MSSEERIFKINGHDFEKMVRNGLANLSLHVEEINALNVFPVPDGDTGSNMYLTLKNAVENTSGDEDIDDYLNELSKEMLFGARGNSGVILSQLFKGLSDKIDGKDEADVGDLCSALVAGYQRAYESVQQPVEGTMLTVAREGIEKIRSQITSKTTVDRLLSFYIAEMRKSLAYTPMLLPKLKEAGVVDSGGMGYITIVEGMLKAIYGEIITPSLPQSTMNVKTAFRQDSSAFHADSVFELGYCMEFVLQLLNARGDVKDFDLKAFGLKLNELGNSGVIVRTDDRVKVHIHTQMPSDIMTLAQLYGEFVSFKLENMQIQHTEFEQTAQVPVSVPLAVLAVCHGKGMIDLYKEFDYCTIIDGGEMMNASCQEFINAFERMNADNIVVLPNNKNTISAARQAAELFKLRNIEVLPSTNIVQGYQVLCMDMGSEEIADRLEAMKNNLKDVRTLCLARAVRSSTIRGENCDTGDYLAFMDGRVLAWHYDAVTLIKKVFSLPEANLEPEYLQVYCGAALNEERVSSLNKELADTFPDMDIELIESGQTVYDMIICIM